MFMDFQSSADILTKEVVTDFCKKMSDKKLQLCVTDSTCTMNNQDKGDSANTLKSS